ncbi:MAG TPA: protein translocase subunit SecF [Acidimicrobiales bacterium]|nr:protein translocase subunit SecF [Acidimicrobiales bacterium]
MSPERIRPGSARAKAVPATGTPVGPSAPLDEVAAPYVASPEAGVEDEVLEEVDDETFGDELADDEPSGDETFEEQTFEEEPAETAPAGRVRAGRLGRGRSRVEEADDELGELSAATAVSASPVGSARRRRFFTRLYYGETNVDFVSRRRWWFTVSSVIILAGAISLATRGLNLGIDFVGGSAWTVKSQTLTIDGARAAVAPTGLSSATITVLGNASSSRTVEVQARLPKGQSPGQTQAESQRVAQALASAARLPSQAVGTETVGPSWGSQITNKAVEALIVFFILIALYISVFFEWRMALAAIIAVAHDILITVGIYSLTGLEVTPDTVVALLTILGYSLYDTIVVFDRVRDNAKVLGQSGRLTFSDLVNLSMNQTLARSINTSLVAIMPILAVLVLGAEILGATTLEYFGFALLIGLTTGAYSSIFIASPLVAVMKEREPRYRQIRARLAQRGTEHQLLTPAEVAAGVLAGEPSPERARRRERQGASTTRGRVRPGSAAARAAGGTTALDAAAAADQPGDGSAGGTLGDVGAASGNGAARPARPAPRGGRPSGGRPPSRSRKKGGRR